jgi:thermostable 8-oxoguanine DNA glycosylase
MMADVLVDGSAERNQRELQQFAIFSVCVAGKNADTMLKCVRDFIESGVDSTGIDDPFEMINSLHDSGELAECLRKSGIGCYNRRARTLSELARSGIDLSSCSAADLEAIWGIGPKTARFFLLYSRDDVDDIAVLDVHILRWLRARGYKVPLHTPPSGSRYREIEQLFLRHVPRGKSVAEFDYEIWQEMRK